MTMEEIKDLICNNIDEFCFMGVYPEGNQGKPTILLETSYDFLEKHSIDIEEFCIIFE